jgi:hypothetical protein
MFKPLIQKLDDIHHGNGNGGFGSVFPAGYGLPEIAVAVPEAQVALTGQRPDQGTEQHFGRGAGSPDSFATGKRKTQDSSEADYLRSDSSSRES